MSSAVPAEMMLLETVRCCLSLLCCVGFFVSTIKIIFMFRILGSVPCCDYIKLIRYVLFFCCHLCLAQVDCALDPGNVQMIVMPCSAEFEDLTFQLGRHEFTLTVSPK